MQNVQILFIQGIYNFSLKEGFIDDVSSTTGMKVVHFPILYGLFDTEKHMDLLARINSHIEGSDSRFIILAHSFGGILAYALSDDAYKKIDKIVTIATPHSVPFGWFRNVVQKLPHRIEVPVPVQESCGLFFDITVPFFFTRHQHAHMHRNVFGAHTFVPNRKAFFKKLVLGGEST